MTLKSLRYLRSKKNGDISTFPPEFAGMPSEKYNNFVIGNVLHLNHLSELCENVFYLKMKEAVEKGKKNCAATCMHFDLCGSAFLANRYSETGSLESTVSLACLLHKQALNTTVINKLRSKNASCKNQLHTSFRRCAVDFMFKVAIVLGQLPGIYVPSLIMHMGDTYLAI